jgi:hypothetical protein
MFAPVNSFGEIDSWADSPTNYNVINWEINPQESECKSELFFALMAIPTEQVEQQIGRSIEINFHG